MLKRRVSSARQKAGCESVSLMSVHGRLFH